MQADYTTRAGRRRLYSYVAGLRRRGEKLAAKLRYMEALDAKITKRLHETSPGKYLSKDPRTGRWCRKEYAQK